MAKYASSATWEPCREAVDRHHRAIDVSHRDVALPADGSSQWIDRDQLVGLLMALFLIVMGFGMGFVSHVIWGQCA